MRRVAAAVVVVAIAALVVWLIVSGTAAPHLEEEALRSRIESWGVFGPIGFVLVMWLVQPFGVPGVLFMVPASLVWSAPLAIVLSWIGNMGASWIAFEVTRRMGQEWVAERIPERVRGFDQRLASGGWWPVFLLRVVTGQIPAADWMLGVSTVRRGPFLFGTGLGILPGVIVTIVYGADLLGWLRDHPGVGLLLLVVALGRRIPGWLRRRRDAGDTTAGLALDRGSTGVEGGAADGTPSGGR